MDPRSLVAAIDQGTTSSRCILFDRSGRPVASHQLEHAQITPRPGWVEHDAEEILERVRTCVRVALRDAGADARALAAVGISDQRETTVVWSRRTGRPVHNAIVWQDTRTAGACERLAAGDPLGADRFRALTGLPISTYSSALKLAWILDDGGGERRAAAAAGDLLFGTIDTWLIWHLTGGVDGGVHVTDATNASRTMLMGLDSLAWEPELLDAVGVPAAMLPAIRSSSEVYGTGVGDLAGVPIAGDLGDQQAALFGQTCFETGQLKCTYGTGCFMLMHTGERPVHSAHGLITTVAARLGAGPATYALEGSVAVAGALIGWLRDNLGIIGDASEVEALARSVPDSGDVVLVPAFSGLFAPHWRSDARGIIAGLTAYATRGNIARAALEATAYQVYDLGVAMVADLGDVAAGRAPGRRRDDPERPADAVPGGHPRPAGGGAPDRRDQRPGRRLRGGPGGRVLVRPGRAPRDGPRRPSLDPDMDEATRAAGIARWHKGVERTLGWVDPTG